PEPDPEEPEAEEPEAEPEDAPEAEPADAPDDEVFALSSADWSDFRYPVLVYVAPDTASICALCAATASWLSLGTARPVCWALRPPLGACTASALVTLPFATVSRTCTVPYWVWAASPVTVPADCAPPF